ncbi:hypothetical protein [Streptomyces sp. CB01881]|nr:hypothetical protein [Streptomyces sp. CB01881]
MSLWAHASLGFTYLSPAVGACTLFATSLATATTTATTTTATKAI